MSARDELVQTIIEHPWLSDHDGLYTGLCPSCPERQIHGGHNSPSHAEHLSDAILAAGYRKPRTVTTIDELDAAVYAAFEDDGHLVLTDRQGRPWIIWADEDGDEVVNSWPQEEDPERLALSDIRLPATVMHHGARTLLHEGNADV